MFIKLIVGLGNPGSDYAKTRHNAGFWWINELCANERVSLKPDKKFHGNTARLSVGGHELWLLQPMTYMNVSGRAVLALATFYKIVPQEILVVHDELDLPPGTVKMKHGGGHGGHNGLKDIVAHLSTPDFWRLRIGIGHPGDRDAVLHFVLRPPRVEERVAMEESITRSLQIFPQIARGDLQAAMLKLHTRPKVEVDSKEESK
ncbi:MAG: aminoacyl-tRNA hydrolase [Pseudomonadota bacterium]|nr:aminoacyl-tRNA hydrolase [Pseudomonadota bacterium]